METKVEPLIQTVLQDRIFGRKYQSATLREAYKRICGSSSDDTELPHCGVRRPELVLLTGVSGTGKTTLAYDLKRYISSRDCEEAHCLGNFIRGKYDHLHRKNQVPFGGFVEAFAEYANQIVEEGDGIVHEIRVLVRGNKLVDRKLLVQVVPGLEVLLGESSGETTDDDSQAGGSAPVLSDSQRNRFRFTFLELVGVLSVYRSIVIFLDDLQWCDRDSLELFSALVMLAPKGLMILGACRGNEVAVSDPLAECLRSIEANGVIITDIALECLDEPMVHELLSISLQLERKECAELANVLFHQTGGNFFYLTHFTNALQLDKVLYYDDKNARWMWDGQKLRVLRSSSVELMRKMMRRLPEQVQTVLKTAASIGAKFSVSVILLLLPSINVESALETASRVAFIAVEPLVGEYSFSHDQIQEAAYTLIAEDERSAFHWDLCRKLWTKGPGKEEHRLSLVVGQITKCAPEIKSDDDRRMAATFLLKASKKASCSFAFGTSLAYLQLGIDLLGKKRWQHEYYDMCLTMHNLAAEVSYGVGDSTRLDNLTDAVFLHAKDYEDKLPAYTMKILSLGSAHKLHDAMELGLEVLTKVGEPFGRTTKVGALIEARQMRRMLRKLSSSEVLNLPLMTDPRKLVAMRVIDLLFLYAFFGKPEYVLPLAARLIKLTLEHGLSAISSDGFSTFSIILASNIPLISDIDEAYDLAKLSLDIVEKFASTKKQWLPRLYVGGYGMVFPWKEPLTNCIEPLFHAYRVGMRTGDVEFAMMAAMLHATYKVLWGMPLHQVGKDIAEFRKTTKAYSIHLVDSLLSPLQQLVANLTGEIESKDVFISTGVHRDGQQEKQELSLNTNLTSRLHILLMKSLLALYMGNWELAESSHRAIKTIDEGSRSCLTLCAYHFQGAMIASALLQKHGRNRRRSRTLKRSFRVIQKMTENCPTNFYMMQTLLEAEQSVLQGKVDKAINRYKIAIDVSRKEGTLNFEGLSADRLAQILERDKRRSTQACESYIEARTAFKTWGANVKVDQLNDIIANWNDVDGS